MARPNAATSRSSGGSKMRVGAAAGVTGIPVLRANAKQKYTIFENA